MEIICITPTWCQKKQKHIAVGSVHTLHRAIQLKQILLFELSGITYSARQYLTKHHRFIPRHFTTKDGYYAHLLRAKSGTPAAKVFGEQKLHLFGLRVENSIDLVQCRVLGYFNKQPEGYDTEFPLEMFWHYQKPPTKKDAR